MRITVNLSIFFHDHRSLAKIFVKKEMKCIKDVEYHISEIFNIENFYLKCENVYLPPTEDVQILQHDDIVWVVPIEDNVVVKKKKSKKQKNLPDNTPEIKESVKDSGHESLSSNKCEDTTPEEKNINVASLVHTFENQLHDSTSSPIEKKINIVKTIIISNKNTSGKLKPTTTNNEEFNMPKREKLEIIGNCSDIQNGTSEGPKPTTSNNKHSSLRKEDNLETFNSPNNKSRKEDEFRDYDSSSTWDTASICNSTKSEIGVHKRKRKRTRRKKLPENKNEFNAIFQPPVDNLVQKRTNVQAVTHIRFSDDQLSPEIKDFDVSQVVVNVNELKDCLKPEEVSDSMVIDHDSEQNKETTADAVITDLEVSNTNEEIENCTLKQPIVEGAEPKLGDVIDFRILRISENYTPEISSTIVGKVIDYQEVNKEVTFNVIHGLDQCVVPQGKFSLNQEEEPVENTQFQCSWHSLLQPRLIFP